MASSAPADVARAAAILRDGGLVAFPTETVYGLGANAGDAGAVARIFEAKGRPHFDPLIVHIAELSWLEAIVRHVPQTAMRLAERFWPGPLSLVLAKTEQIPDLVTAGLPNVAVRMPNHPVAQQLLRAADIPLAAPSANLFGRLSPTSAAAVAEQLGERVDLILDGGPCRVGVESTVLDLSGATPRLLRPGGVPLEEIESLIGPVEIVASTDHPGEAPQAAPGMLPQHYAPRTPLRVLDHGTDIGELVQASSRVGLLAFRSHSAVESGAFAEVEILSSTGDLREAAAGFFAALRRLDAAGLDVIVAQSFPESGLGRALNDRLRRAAAR